jgi:hypothetical protein
MLLAVGIGIASLTIWTAGYALNLYSMLDFTKADLQTLLDDIPLLRYAIVPLMLLYAFVGLAVGSQDLSRASFRRGVAAAVIVLCTALFAVSYHIDVPTLRLAGPTWSNGLATARTQCAQSPSAQDVVIPIAPVEYWTFTIECSRISP